MKKNIHSTRVSFLSLLLPVLLTGCSSLAIPVESTASTTVGKPYSNSDIGIHFTIPSYFSVDTETVRDRGPAGEIVTMSSVAALSEDPFMGVLVRTIEDPLRNEMFPNLYPPGADTLRLLMITEITEIDQEKSEANKNAAINASESALVSRISGFHSISYRVGLDSRTYGHRYVRGALVVTPTRDISLYVIGSDEAGVRGSVTPLEIDAIWNALMDSLVIDF